MMNSYGKSANESLCVVLDVTDRDSCCSPTLLMLQAGLIVGDMILAVNKDTLLGSDYDSVSRRIVFSFGTAGSSEEGKSSCSLLCYRLLLC
jgi:hypothetical protein